MMMLPTCARYHPRRIVTVAVISAMAFTLLLAAQYLKTSVRETVLGIARGASVNSRKSDYRLQMNILENQDEFATQDTSSPQTETKKSQTRFTQKQKPPAEKRTTKSPERQRFKEEQALNSRRETNTLGESERQKIKSPIVTRKQTPARKSQKQKVEEDPQNVGNIFEQRRAVYESVCRKWKEKEGREVEGSVRAPYVYLPANISFCRVPKVGVTFWKRVFFFLFNKTGDSSKQVTNPLDIERLYVHHHGAGPENSVSIKSAQGARVVFSTRRIMFARDPWSRLWSAYVDKFVLPDSWLDIGQKVMALRDELTTQQAARLKVQSQYERQALTDVGKYRVDKTQKCADDITFAESLHYVLNSKANPHWLPVHRVCNPCVFRPTYLGTTETFSRDSNFILHSAGLGHLIPNQKDHENHVQDELQLLTAYHFQLWKQRLKLHPCLDKVGLARRLWAAFQLNGYLPLDHPFPAQLMTSQLRDVTLEEAQERFMKQVMAAHAKNSLDRSQWSAFRRRVMVAAYRAVPREMLYGIQKMFRLDFQLFQYDAQPKDIFGE